LKKTQTNGKVFQVHGLEELILLKYLISKAIYRFSAFFKTPITLFYTDTGKTILKFACNYRRHHYRPVKTNKWSCQGQGTNSNIENSVALLHSCNE
jgi:hypothetical protein